MRQQRLDRLAVALHDREHPSGRPASCQSRARNRDADGSLSLGFSTKALPQAMAFAHIHSGTMAGKLNGVMPATTPSGWRML